MMPDQLARGRIRDWLNDRFGIFFPDHKGDLLNHRLSRVVERFQLDGLHDLANRVETGQHQELLMAVMHAASTNHTYFFREPQVLDFFARSILPPLAQRDEIRIWSAAVSTGDEAYTTAIIAAELWGLETARSRLAILGTDISGPVIRRAETGIYGDVHIENTPRNILDRYFHPSGDSQYQVSGGIRSMCTFRRLNLNSEPYPFQKSFDVIFCRNVLYYFDRKTQHRALEAIYDVCAPGGWLLTSVTESVRDLGTRWVSTGGGIHRKLA
jgi:chemotaxis protein methyltransferase CheR